jgi:hypothetical protein
MKKRQPILTVAAACKSASKVGSYHATERVSGGKTTQRLQSGCAGRREFQRSLLKKMRTKKRQMSLRFVKR